MFYDKSVEILSFSEGCLDDSGLWVEGALSTLKTIKCDVQPLGKNTAYRDYSFSNDVKYQVFCDVDEDLSLNTQLKYNGNIYFVVRLIDWDDYYILLLDDKAGEVDG